MGRDENEARDVSVRVAYVGVILRSPFESQGLAAMDDNTYLYSSFYLFIYLLFLLFFSFYL